MVVALLLLALSASFKQAVHHFGFMEFVASLRFVIIIIIAITVSALVDEGVYSWINQSTAQLERAAVLFWFSE